MSQKMSRIISVFVFVLLVAGWILYIRPLRANISEYENLRSGKEEKLQELQHTVDELLKLQEQLPSSEIERKKMLVNIPETVEQHQLVQYFDSVSDRHDISFSNLNFALSGELLSGISIVSISANFKGTYDDLLQFLDTLEDARRVIRVKSVNVQVFDVDKSSFHLNMEAYYQS